MCLLHEDNQFVLALTIEKDNYSWFLWSLASYKLLKMNWRVEEFIIHWLHNSAFYIIEWLPLATKHGYTKTKNVTVISWQCWGITQNNGNITRLYVENIDMNMTTVLENERTIYYTSGWTAWHKQKDNLLMFTKSCNINLWIRVGDVDFLIFMLVGVLFFSEIHDICVLRAQCISVIIDLLWIMTVWYAREEYSKVIRALALSQ